MQTDWERGCLPFHQAQAHKGLTPSQKKLREPFKGAHAFPLMDRFIHRPGSVANREQKRNKPGCRLYAPKIRKLQADPPSKERQVGPWADLSGSRTAKCVAFMTRVANPEVRDGESCRHSFSAALCGTPPGAVVYNPSDFHGRAL